MKKTLKVSVKNADERYKKLLAGFAEGLKELMFEKNVKVAEVSRAIGVSESTVYRYIAQTRLPETEKLIRLADYFQCTLEVLLDVEEKSDTQNFHPCPPFSERFDFLLKSFGVTKYKLSRAAEIPESILYTWQNGTHFPTIVNIGKLSEYFGCPLDYIIGRVTIDGLPRCVHIGEKHDKR